MIGEFSDGVVCVGVVDVIGHIVVLFVDPQLGVVGLLDSSFRVLVLADAGLVHLVALGGLTNAVLFRWSVLLLVSHKRVLADHFLRLDLIVL